MLGPRCPLVSVLLPVYNGAEYLAASIESILSQTYRNLELIIVDDGSEDNSAEIIRRFHDPRIRPYHQENQGLARTLNRAILMAEGEFIARQDQDDLSLPQRLEKQIMFFETHPHHGMVGGWAEIWVGNTRSERIHRHPADNHYLQFDLLFDNPFVHSSMMLRKSVFETVGLYSTDKARQPPEDYELWSRVARQFAIANIPEVLLVYREVLGSMSRVGARPFLDRLIKISVENLLWITGKPSADSHVTDVAALNHAAYHRVSPRPRIGKMSKVIYDAADRLSDAYQVPRRILRERALVRFNNVKAHYSRHMEQAGQRSLVNLIWTVKSSALSKMVATLMRGM